MQPIFEALASAPRRKILAYLAEAELTAGEIAARFSMSKPAISKHLRVLRQAHLVREQRRGKERHYALEPMPLQRVAGWIEGYRAFWLRNLNQLKAYLESP